MRFIPDMKTQFNSPKLVLSITEVKNFMVKSRQAFDKISQSYNNKIRNKVNMAFFATSFPYQPGSSR